MKITSRFKVLLAEKELRDKRSYTMKDVASATNVSIYTITALANNTLREFPLAAMGEVCKFLECTTGDLLEYDPNGIRASTLSLLVEQASPG